MMNLPSGIVGHRPEVVILVALLQERRRDHEAEDRDGDEPADHGAEAEGRDLEELRARVAVGGILRRQLLALDDRRAALGRHLVRLGQLRARGQVAHPEEAEDEREDRAERGDVPGDDQADEEHHDADGEADRPEARARNVRVLVVGRVRQGASRRDSSGRGRSWSTS